MPRPRSRNAKAPKIDSKSKEHPELIKYDPSRDNADLDKTLTCMYHASMNGTVDETSVITIQGVDGTEFTVSPAAFEDAEADAVLLKVYQVGTRIHVEVAVRVGEQPAGRGFQRGGVDDGVIHERASLSCK